MRTKTSITKGALLRATVLAALALTAFPAAAALVDNGPSLDGIARTLLPTAPIERVAGGGERPPPAGTNGPSLDGLAAM